MLEKGCSSSVITTALSPGELYATKLEPTCDSNETDECQERAVGVSPFDDLPDDVLIHLLSWLEMGDMVSASQVSTRWRQIALSMASLWWDVQLTDVGAKSANRFITIASRAKDVPINAKITVENPRNRSNQLRPTALRFLEQHGHHLGSLELDLDAMTCSPVPCMLESLSIFQDAVKSGRQAGIVHASSWQRMGNVCFRFPDLRAMRTVELRRGMFPCALRFSTVTHVRLLDFGTVPMSTLDKICTAFPGMTSLEIIADDVSYFGQERALGYFIERMSRVERLSVTTKMFDEGVASMAAVLRWPVRKIELDVSASGNGFARRARGILRELLTDDSTLTVRSTRQRNATGEWTPKYFITVRVGSGVGREFTFIQESFTRVLQNYVAPLLREKQVQTVVVDGHAACALFYTACGTADLAHITTLRIVAGEPNSIRAPQKEVRLSGLIELALEKDPMCGSRITAATVEGLLSKLVTNERVSLRLKDVFVYADGGQVDIGQYADLVEGAVYPPSWRHIVSPTA